MTNQDFMPKEVVNASEGNREYVSHCKNLAYSLIEWNRVIVEGRIYKYNVNHVNQSCELCPAYEYCNAKLCIICMFADEAYQEKCVREKLFYHPVQLVPID